MIVLNFKICIVLIDFVILILVLMFRKEILYIFFLMFIKVWRLVDLLNEVG